MDFSGVFEGMLAMMWVGIVFTVLSAMVKNLKIRKESDPHAVRRTPEMGAYGRTSPAPGN